MRNVIATVCQVVAFALFLAGLWAVSPFLTAAAAVGVVGWVLAPDKPL